MSRTVSKSNRYCPALLLGNIMGFCVLIFDRQLFTTHKVGCFRRIVKNVILMIRFLAWKFTVRYSIITYNCRDNFGSIFEGERAKKTYVRKKEEKRRNCKFSFDAWNYCLSWGICLFGIPVVYNLSGLQSWGR